MKNGLSKIKLLAIVLFVTIGILIVKENHHCSGEDCEICFLSIFGLLICQTLMMLTAIPLLIKKIILILYNENKFFKMASSHISYDETANCLTVSTNNTLVDFGVKFQ